MTIVGMDDLAAVSLSPSAKLTWGTATDWNNAVAESNVVHEASQTGYSTPAGGDVIVLGYPTSDEGGTTLFAFHPGDEGSGTTLNDVSGNANDATMTGATPGGTGATWGSTAWSYDGVDDYGDIGSGLYTSLSAITFSAWVKINGKNDNNPRVVGTSDTSVRLAYGNFVNDALDIQIWVGGTGYNVTSTTTFVYDGTESWHHFAFTWDGSTLRLYIDGSEEGNVSASGTAIDDPTNGVFYGNKSGGTSDHHLGKIEDGRWYSRALSASEISTQAGTSGSLTGATQSFTTAQTPDLVDLLYNLNGGSIDIDVIGSPGTTSEEIVNSGGLDGTQTSATLTWANSHTDFRVRPNLSITSITDASPDVSQIALK